MDTFYIHTGEKYLFTNFHAANDSIEKDIGVVLCYPFGQEYIRCHRTFVKLASELSLNGYNTLRFDFLGCGDSYGDAEQVSIKDWLENIYLAIKEIREGCGVTKIVLIGIRLGATLAELFSRENKIYGLCSWGPVYDGKNYLKEIDLSYKHWLSGSFAKIRDKSKEYSENYGFPISNRIYDEIKEINLLNKPIPDINYLLIDNKMKKLVSKHLAQFTDNNKHFFNTDAEDFWIKQEDELAKSLVPVKEIEEIINWLNTIYKVLN